MADKPVTSCFPSATLVGVLEGRLPEAELAAVREHLIDCPDCRESMDRLSEESTLSGFHAGLLRQNPRFDQEAPLESLRQRLKSDVSSNGDTNTTAAATTLTIGDTDASLCGVSWPEHLTPLQLLGRGGMGLVWLARDTILNRDVAVKMLRLDRADEQNRNRFLKEAQAVARMRHPNIVTVHSAECPPAGLPYLVMDYVPGCSLRELIAKQGPLEPKCAADLLIQMCHGLHQAHGSGLVHRDIKPGNLLLQADPTNTKSGWRVCIVDFGLVRLTDSDAGTSVSEVIAGTPAYMSPEQITAPESVGPASDIYGLGITLYEMLTGGVPWGGTPHMIMKQILEATPRTPRQWNDAIPVDLETICLKAMDDEPARRYATALQLAEDIQRWQRGEPVLARPVSIFQRGLRWCRRNPALSAVSLGVLVLLILVAAGATAAAYLISRSEQRALQNWKTSEFNRRKADSESLRAQSAQLTAERNAQSAVEAYNHLIFNVQQELKGTSGTLELRRRLLEQAIPGLQKIVADAQSSGTLDHSVLTALLRQAEVVWFLGRAAEAQDLYQQCLSLSEGTLTASQANPEIHLDRGLALEQLGVLAQHANNIAEARKYYTRALEEFELANESRRNFHEAQRRLAWAHSRLGDVEGMENQFAEMLSHYESACSILNQLSEFDQSSATYRSDLAAFLHRRGWAFEGLRRDQEAMQDYRHAQDLDAKLLEENPTDTDLLRRTALILQSTGRLLVSRGKAAEAKPFFSDSLQKIEQLQSADPNNAELSYDLSVSLEINSACAEIEGRKNDARTFLHRQQQVLAGLVARYPTNAKFRISAATASLCLVLHDLRIGEFKHASDNCAAAVKLLETVSIDPNQQIPYVQSVLSQLRHLGAALPMADAAIADLSKAEHDTRDVATELLLIRAIGLAHRGQHADSVAAAEKVLTALSPDPQTAAIQMMQVASVFATLAAKHQAADVTAPSAPGLNELTRTCDDRSMQLLQQSIQQFPPLKSVAATWFEFQRLQKRDDFQKLLSTP